MQNELAKTNFTAQELAKKIKLKVIYDPQKQLIISTPNVNRVGLQLTGYFEYFANERVQVIGPSEVHFLEALSQDEKQRVVGDFFKNSFPCIVFSRDLDIDEVFLQHAKQPCLHGYGYFYPCKPMLLACLQDVYFELSFVKMLAC